MLRARLKEGRPYSRPFISEKTGLKVWRAAPYEDLAGVLMCWVYPGFSYGELMAIKLPSGEWGYAKRKDLVYRVKAGRRVIDTRAK